MSDSRAERCADASLRAQWLRLLSLATAPMLAAVCTPVLADFSFDWLRRPEHGLVMVRARIGNGGDRFNLGEATVTRCAVSHQPEAGDAVAGIGHVLGLDDVRAERIAQVDALLQVPALHALLDDGVLRPLRVQLAQRQHDEQRRAAASRVRFFTLQGEAP